MSLQLSSRIVLLLAFFPLLSPAADVLAAMDAPNQADALLRGAVHPAGPSGGSTTRSAIATTAAQRKEVAAGFLPRLKFANYRYEPAPKVVLASFHPAQLQRPAVSRHARPRVHGLIKWLASPRCLPRKLKKILGDVAAKFASVSVNSTHRSKYHNRLVGGAKHSYHLRCQAADFHVSGNYRAVLAFLRKQPGVGGIKHYGAGVFHIDTGRRRSW